MKAASFDAAKGGDPHHDHVRCAALAAMKAASFDAAKAACFVSKQPLVKSCRNEGRVVRRGEACRMDGPQRVFQPAAQGPRGAAMKAASFDAAKLKTFA